MTDATPPQPVAFRAEIRQLLNILIHSLYTDREIFLRELISNASDAVNRLQFEMLTNHNMLDPQAELAIRINANAEERTLTLRDSGLGMTHDELIENLGTIAHSGAATFLANLQEGAKPADLIGQFGVGFYSVFMVAEEVRVTSRSFRPEEPAWTWICQGGESFTLEPAEQAERGTRIWIKLKEDAKEFAESYRLKDIIHRHSDFVAYPIYLDDQAEAVNRQTSLWRQPAAQVTDEAANDFYKQLTLDFQAPLARVQLATDAPVQIHALLFIPASAERGMFSLRQKHGLKLYSRKILIQEYCQDLLPNYLRFVEGVVESEDIPLSVSRETVQSTRVMERIKNAVTHKAIDSLKELALKEPEKYHTFWKNFGAFIKEGMASDAGGRERLLPLLRFASSRTAEDELVSLAEYTARVKLDQRTIYYLLGDQLKSISHSPHLDYFRREGLEVLFLTDPLDAFMLTGLTTYEGFPLQNVADAKLDLPAAAPETSAKTPADDLAPLLARLKARLGDKVTETRVSRVLVDSPARLLDPDGARSHEMDRVRRMLEKEFKAPPKLMEINPSHPLIKNLVSLLAAGQREALVDDCLDQLYENSLLLEGLHPNPAEMVGRLQGLMEAATRA